jgi:hypothetical protein
MEYLDPLKIGSKNGTGIIGSVQPAQPKQLPFNIQSPFQKPIQTDQSLADGDLKVDETGVYYTPPYKKTAASDTVAGQLEGLLAKESPYMQAAQTGAKQSAASKGLLNTTMAATAGQKAAIESALPIAQADAGYFQQQELAKQQAELQKGLYETQGDISAKLSKQQHEQDMAKQSAQIDWQKLELQAKMDVETARLDEANKKMFNDTVNAINEDYMNDYMEIMLNPNFATDADRQAAIDVLNENTRKRLEVAASVANATLEWEPPTETAKKKEEPTEEETKKEEAPSGPGYGVYQGPISW